MWYIFFISSLVLTLKQASLNLVRKHFPLVFLSFQIPICVITSCDKLPQVCIYTPHSVYLLTYKCIVWFFVDGHWFNTFQLIGDVTENYYHSCTGCSCPILHSTPPLCTPCILTYKCIVWFFVDGHWFNTFHLIGDVTALVRNIAIHIQGVVAPFSKVVGYPTRRQNMCVCKNTVTMMKTTRGNVNLYLYMNHCRNNDTY